MSFKNENSKKVLQMLLISRIFLLFQFKTSVAIILITMTNRTYTIYRAFVSQCFKYGFYFIYFSVFNAGERKYSCNMLTDQKEQARPPYIIGNLFLW